MTKLQTELMERAKQSLLNTQEITEEIVEKAMTEAQELTLNKKIPKPNLMDLAMFRLKLWLKVETSEEDESLARQALKVASDTPVLDGEGKVKKTSYRYGKRISEL